MSLPITDFLLARYAEEEAIARAATPGPWSYEPGTVSAAEPHPESLNSYPSRWVAATSYDDQSGTVYNSDNDGAHIARHDPARVLADIEGKRQIVARLASVNAPHSRDWTTGTPGADPEYVGGVSAALEYVGQMLALPYADHPDYRPEWVL